MHHDHLDLPSLRGLDPSAPVLAPPDAAGALRRARRPVRALVPGEEVEVAGVTVRAVRADHDGRRYPVGTAVNSLGFVAGGVYFAGDTEPFPEMAELAGTLDAALLPVSGWGPKTGPGHMDPREAAEALALVRPRLAVPIHWGTYHRIGHRATGRPAARVRRARRGARARGPRRRARAGRVGGDHPGGVTAAHPAVREDPRP